MFQWLSQIGNINNEEMFKVFNQGIGMALNVSKEDEDFVEKHFKILNK